MLKKDNVEWLLLSTCLLLALDAEGTRVTDFKLDVLTAILALGFCVVGARQLRSSRLGGRRGPSTGVSIYLLWIGGANFLLRLVSTKVSIPRGTFTTLFSTILAIAFVILLGTMLLSLLVIRRQSN